jgi:hypothetical protein
MNYRLLRERERVNCPSQEEMEMAINPRTYAVQD